MFHSVSLRRYFPILFWVGLAACNPKYILDRNELSVQIQEAPVTMRNGKVLVEAELKFNPNFISPKGVVWIGLYQQTPIGKQLKDHKVVFGNKVKNLDGAMIQSNQGFQGKCTYSGNYDSSLKRSEWWLECHSFGASKTNLREAAEMLDGHKTFEIPSKASSFEVKLAEGTSLISRLYHHQSDLVSFSSNYIPDTVKPYEATIYFELNKSVIRESELKKDEILQLADYLSKQKEILKIEVNGYASPDGELQFNNELANERATAAGVFVMETLKTSKGLRNIKYNLNNNKLYVQNKGTEDWSGLLKGIEFARIPQKELVKEIITSSLSSVEKQAKLRNMEASWDALAEDYLPPLRRANMVITTRFVPRNQAERIELIRSGSNEMSSEEFLLTAEQCEDATVQADVLEKMKLQYPTDPRSYNLLAVQEMKAGRPESAAKNLEAALEASPTNPALFQNLAWAYYLTENWSKLSGLAKRAQGQKVDFTEYQALLALRDGKYKEVISLLQNREPSFNLALAYTLEKKFTEASQILQKLNPENSKVLYLSAVVAARLQDSAGVQKNLIAWVKAEPSQRNTLKNDPEFAAYRGEGFFKGLTL